MPTEKYNIFVPKLSPHSLRLIRKIFVDNNNSQDLIRDLESQVTIFDKISLDEHESFFMKFNKENIFTNGKNPASALSSAQLEAARARVT